MARYGGDEFAVLGTIAADGANSRLRARYAELLPFVADRGDLDYVFGEIAGAMAWRPNVRPTKNAPTTRTTAASRRINDGPFSMLMK